MSKSDAIKKQIDEAIDSLINPGLAAHGGFVRVVHVDLESAPPSVAVAFKGGCSGCSSAYTDTLYAIEEILQEETSISDLRVENIEGKKKDGD